MLETIQATTEANLGPAKSYEVIKGCFKDKGQCQHYVIVKYDNSSLERIMTSDDTLDTIDGSVNPIKDFHEQEEIERQERKEKEEQQRQKAELERLARIEREKKKVKSWKMSDMCFQTFPCQHHLEIVYEDDEKDKRYYVLDGTVLNTVNGPVKLNFHGGNYETFDVFKRE